MIYLLAAAALSTTIPKYASFRPKAAQIEALYGTAYQKCLDRSGGVTSSMRDCSSTEATRIDGLLNQEYRAELQRLQPSRRTALRSLERSWLKTRHGNCEREAKSEEGGTIWLLIMDGCGLDEAFRRTLWLRTVGR